MLATSTLNLADLGRNKRLRVGLDEELTPAHTVGHAVETFLERMAISTNGLQFSAFSRGVRLDRKSTLADLPETDTDWSVIPDVSAGSR